MINNFHAKGYEFLSNFYPAPVVYRDVIYPTVEHAFQAAKTLSFGERSVILSCPTPALAKKAGRKVTLRAGWEQMKVNVMAHLLRQKFAIPALRKKLLSTGDHQLIEGNWWNDRFWGVCGGAGLNHLGRLLMQIRKEIADERSRQSNVTDGARQQAFI